MAKKRQKVKLELTRRDFLTMAGTAAGSAVFAQALTTGPLSPFADPSSQRQVTGAEGGSGQPVVGKRWGMVINLDTLHRLRVLPAGLLGHQRCRPR